MYVIVDIQGQQFKVSQGQKLFVHRITAELGSELEFEKVMLVDDGEKVTVGAPLVDGAKVVVEVLSHVKGDKVLVFKKKRRKGHQKLNGHRQQFSEVQVKEIVHQN
ncbi:MAG: 50S ribosomal protein L21 [Bacteroidota bacterium]|nr:50S ribosomal protein L21 [Bacteroidota bacterium]